MIAIPRQAQLLYILVMRRFGLVIAMLFVFLFALLPLLSKPSSHTTVLQGAKSQTFLGFDRNEYPGDTTLPVLRETFAFASYWIGPPPGEKVSSWIGKRPLLEAQGFGFAVLFNGRDSPTLKNAADARQKGGADAERAAKSAEREGFTKGTIIFLDIEEGGRLPASYHEYLLNWAEGLARAGYRAGVYCSAIPASEGSGLSITTAKDILDHAGSREIVFWVYNDACPPSPGCSLAPSAPSPALIGNSSAAIWQYAQSPRRKEFTRLCPANYAADGNCYAPGDSLHKWFLDLNVASSANPSAAK
jgi:Domain of unknown function (DUF1906)